ncbi:xanthine dehydrogenase molybdopterin binding subunit [soil metagenome]
MKNIDSIGHVTGRSIYLDDIPTQQGTHFSVVVDSPEAHGKIKHVDYSLAEKVPGVVQIFTYKDIPGENQIGGIIQDEPLFAEDEVHYQGQPVALIVGESEYICRKARKLVRFDIDKLPAITDPREARKKGKLICPPRTFAIGNTTKAWDKCEHIFEGRVDSGGQEHLYIESQGAYAWPMENGNIKIASSTQGPTAVQRTAAKVLGLSMHNIEVDVTRLGGGFGGKEDQATPWAVMVALAAKLLNRGVKLSVHRMDDMRMTGKRHPYSSDYKIGLDSDLNILAYEAVFHQNAGAAADLSPAVMGRTLFHTTNSYFIPNVKATAYSCKTNLPPNTAFRGFGGPQGMFVIESAIARAATEIGVPARNIQEKNLLKEGDTFPYGQVAENVLAGTSWSDACRFYDIENLEREIEQFNRENSIVKKGLAMQPVCFGISFTNTSMNHARALVHVYHDGSVYVSTGAVEMGQGVNTKMLQVAMDMFGINPERIRLDTTNTTRVANTSPTAASAGSDLNGKALEIACSKIRERLLKFAALELNTQPENLSIKNETVFLGDEPADLGWKELVNKAHLARIKLSEKGHYATPVIHFDREKEKGHPFAYHVYGTAILVATVDCIRGQYNFDRVAIVHDFGKSMNRMVDHGQIEGGLVQGMGWMTMEDLSYNNEGRLLSNAFSTYKIPDIYSVPKVIDIKHLETEGHPLAIKKSKAVGEPPLMYGLGAYFAIQNAVKAFNPGYSPTFDAPFTPEKVLMSLYENKEITANPEKDFKMAE